MNIIISDPKGQDLLYVVSITFNIVSYLTCKQEVMTFDVSTEADKCSLSAALLIMFKATVSQTEFSFYIEM